MVSVREVRGGALHDFHDFEGFVRNEGEVVAGGSERRRGRPRFATRIHGTTSYHRRRSSRKDEVLRTSRRSSWRLVADLYATSCHVEDRGQGYRYPRLPKLREKAINVQLRLALQGFGGFSALVHPSPSPHPIVLPRSSPIVHRLPKCRRSPHRPRSLHRASSEPRARVGRVSIPTLQDPRGDWRSGPRTTPITIPKAITSPPYTVT